LLHWEIIGRDVEVQEVERCLELRRELLRWGADIQRSRRHEAVEYGLTPSGQPETRDLQGDSDEISIGRRYRVLLPGDVSQVRPSRDRDVRDCVAGIRLELPPLPFMVKRPLSMKGLLLILPSGLRTDRCIVRVWVSIVDPFLFAAFATADELANATIAMPGGYLF
jgi:hypothetical protein